MPVTISHVKSNTIADFTGTVTVGNSSGGTQTVAATNLVRPSDWNSSHAQTIALAGSELYGEPYFEPYAPLGSTLSAPGVNTWFFDPFHLPHTLGSGQLNFLAADAAGFLNGTTLSAASSGSNTISQTILTQVALYTLGTGANSTRLSSIWSKEISILATWERRVGTTTTSQLTASNYLSLSFPSQWNISGAVTYGSTSQSGTLSVGASTMVSSSINSIISGAVAYVSGSKFMPIPFDTTLAADFYVMGMMIRSTSASAGTNYTLGTAFSTQSMVGIAEHVNQAYKRLGTSVSNASTLVYQWHGSYGTTSTTPPATIATSDMRNLVTNHRRYWNYMSTSY